MPKFINTAIYCGVARGVFSAKGQPQQIPRSTSMPRTMAAPYGVVEADLYELEQCATAMYHDEIKAAQDENP